MKNWDYSFDAVSRGEWIRQIEADLKGKSLDSLTSEGRSGEMLRPIVHREDTVDGIIRLPDALFKDPPLLVEGINTTSISATEINRRILDALKQGSQSIIFYVTQLADGIQDAWLEGVQRDMIELQIQQGTDSAFQIDQKVSAIPFDVKIRLVRPEHSGPLASWLTSSKPNPESQTDHLRLVYPFRSEKHWAQRTVEVFQQLIEDIKSWRLDGRSEKTFFNQCILSYQPGPDYFEQIIQMRVLHLLWQNIKRYYLADENAVINPYFECHIIAQKEEDPNHFLIRASMSGLAASLAGVQRLYFTKADDRENAGYYDHVIRNIHHLLHLESNMYVGSDPLAGSYVIDLHTRQWTSRLWQQFKLE